MTNPDANRDRPSRPPCLACLGVAVGLVVGLGAGCGAGPADEVSTTPMVTQTDPTRSNSSPSVQSLNFVPVRAAPGESVQAVAMAADPDGDSVTLRFAWRVGGRRLLETGPTITVPESAAGSTVEVTVVATDGQDESTPEIARFRVANRAPRVTALDVESLELDGPQGPTPHWRVTAEIDDPDRDRVSVRYEWVVNGRAAAQEGETFPKTGTKRGDEVRVRATPFDGQAHGSSLESPAIVVGNSPPVIVSAPPGLDPTGTFRYGPTVEDPDGDTRLQYRLVEAPEAMKLDEATGEVTWKPTPGDVGTHAVAIEVSDALGGRSRQSFEVRVDVGGSTPPGPAATR